MFDWPLSYISLPLGRNLRPLRFWDSVVEKVARFDGWKKNFLSLGGRITLIMSCFSYVPSYFLSLSKIQISVAIKLEKLQMEFLWLGIGEGKKGQNFSWGVVCGPKQQGV